MQTRLITSSRQTHSPSSFPFSVREAWLPFQPIRVRPGSRPLQCRGGGTFIFLLKSASSKKPLPCWSKC